MSEQAPATPTYTYDPTQIISKGVSKMRFELGDTLIQDKADSAYLSDEEIGAMISAFPNWHKAKLKLAEGVYRKLSFEVSTRIGPASFDLQQRAQHWKTIVNEIRAEASGAASIDGAATSVANQNSSEPYFFSGMHQNSPAGGDLL